MAGPDDMRITFSAKELLERVESKIDGVRDDVSDVKSRVTILELQDAGRRKRRVETREIVVASCSVLLAIAAALGAVNIH